MFLPYASHKNSARTREGPNFILPFRPDKGEIGDVLLLTKPLGTQAAVNFHQWLDSPEKMLLLDGFSERDIKKAYFRAMDSMARLNRTGEHGSSFRPA